MYLIVYGAEDKNAGNVAPEATGNRDLQGLCLIATRRALVTQTIMGSWEDGLGSLLEAGGMKSSSLQFV